MWVWPVREDSLRDGSQVRSSLRILKSPGMASKKGNGSDGTARKKRPPGRDADEDMVRQCVRNLPVRHVPVP